MRMIAVVGRLAAAGLAAAALGSCVSANGPTYSRTLEDVGVPAADQARIVFLRPDPRYDDASASRIVVRIDDRVVGKLAYGGFILADVAPGEVEVEASARNRFFGTCKLTLHPAGGAAASASQAAVGSTAGGMAGSAAEGARAGCGGPYRMTPPAPAVALEHLGRLRASG